MYPETIAYPNRSATKERVFSQETLNRLTTTLLGWRQAPGAFGALLLHACWGEASVLTRRYQGQTIAKTASLLPGVMTLFDKTGDKLWRRFARDIVENLLFLQSPEGGFRHASNEFEPTYTCNETCPIHQSLPITSLLKYAAWPEADGDTREAIVPAVQHFWKWLETAWWRKGNTWAGALSAGWCGVTNQDLCVIAAMALYGKLTGDWGQYEQYGRPALDAFLSPKMYYPAIGLFERGDQANFAERTPYYGIIISMFEAIRDATGDGRLQGVIDNISLHLFDAVCSDEQGDLFLAWGAKTFPDDKSRIEGWIPAPYGVQSRLLRVLADYLARHPDARRTEQLDGLATTLARYIFSDGTTPLSVGAKDPLFSIVPSDSIGFWSYLIEHLGDFVQSPARVRTPTIRRTCGNMSYASSETLWEISRDGSRLFGGFKADASAMAIGPDEMLTGIDFGELSRPEIVEEIITPAP